LSVRKETRDWDYDAVSIGVPAMVGPAGLLAEPDNLGHGWVGFDFGHFQRNARERSLRDARRRARGQ
jgi:hypothetical protein